MTGKLGQMDYLIHFIPPALPVYSTRTGGDLWKHKGHKLQFIFSG